MFDLPTMRGWLIRHPKPVRLRAIDGEGQPHELAVQGQTWIALAETLCALQPDVIEAFDAAGALIRVVRPNDDQGPAVSSSSSSSSVAAVPSAHDDPPTRLLIVMAGLLADAYKHSTDVAFDNLVALFAASNERTRSLERTVDGMQKILQRAAAQQLAAAESATEDEGPLETMLGALAQGVAQAQQNKPTNGKA